MQFSILRVKGRNLARGCAVLVIAAAASGCSSGAMRFSDGLDGITTASTPQATVGNQAQVSQAYPADVAAQPASSGGNYSTAPVGRTALPPPSQPATARANLAPAPAQVAAVASPSATGAVREVQGASKPFQSAGEETKRLTDPRNAPASAQQQMAAGGSYTVQPGDTLSAISRKTGVSVAALQQANGLTGGNIRSGQALKLTGAAGAVAATAAAAAKPANVDPVKTASTPAPTQQTPSEKLASYTPPKQAAKLVEQVQDDGAAAPDSTGIGKMRWPVRGRVISGFGQGGDGIDISVPKGTPVKAAENGVVIYAGDGLKEFGNTVLVRHENGLVTVYGNASELNVKRGQTVKRGEQIALSGMSGNAASPKLHFEIRKNSAPVDPSTFLE